MQKLLNKVLNLQAPGGDNYHWKEVETSIVVTERGWHPIKVEALAKNAKQRNSTDDDDLRVEINGYKLGK